MSPDCRPICSVWGGARMVLISGCRLRLHPVPLIAGVLMCALTVQLGNWQTRRAAEKLAMQAQIESSAHRQAVTPGPGVVPAPWQRVRLAGTWLAQGTILLDNRVHQGRAGYHLITPLQLDDGRAVWVKRGWLAANPDRSRLPERPTVTGRGEVEGVVRVAESGGFSLAAAAGEGVLWQVLDRAAYRAATGVAVEDWLVEQHGEAGDALVRDWPRPDAGLDRHRGYALQWYAMAGLSLVLTLVYVARSFFRHET